MADYEHLLIQSSSGSALEAAHSSEEDFSNLETSMRSDFSSSDFVTSSRSTMRGESFEFADDTDELASPKKEKKKKSKKDKKDKTKKKKKKKSKEKEKDSSKKSSQADSVPDSKTTSTDPTAADNSFDSFPVSFDDIAPSATQPDFTLSLKDDSDSGSAFGGSAFGRAFERAPSVSGFSFGQEDPEKFDNTFAQGGFNAFVQNHEMNAGFFMEDALFAGAGTAHQASSSEMTPRTEATSTTTPVAASASIQAPPLLQEPASNMEQLVEQEAGNNQFQNYLKSTGHDEEIAAATAEAFQAFLKFQAAEKAGASAGNEGNKMIGREIEAMADDVSELGNSVLGNDWENGSFVSYGNMEQQRAHHERQLAKLAEIQRAKGGAPPLPPSSGASVATWGEIKQNESFVRRKAAASSSGFNGFTQQQKPPRSSSMISRVSDDNGSISQSSCGSGSMSRSTNSGSLPRSFHEQWASMTPDQRKCVSSIKRKWERSHPRAKMTDQWYMQFAKTSPGTPFNQKTAYKVMKSTKSHYIDLCDNGMTPKMEKHMLTKTMFPCPGLKTKDGLDVNYVRACRYSPKEAPILHMNQMSVFIMNYRHETNEASCTDGIGVLVNMTGWTMRNFSVPFVHTVCLLIQGFLFPARISSFMFVEAPSWFGSIWSIMKPMLAPSFRRRVHFVKISKLPEYMAPGFEKYLPDDIYGGQASTDEIIHNFFEERKLVDAQKLAQRTSTQV